jgi:hypothetical protein
MCWAPGEDQRLLLTCDMQPVPEGCFFDAGCWHFSHIADQPPYTQNGKHRV